MTIITLDYLGPGDRHVDKGRRDVSVGEVRHGPYRLLTVRLAENCAA